MAYGDETPLAARRAPRAQRYADGLGMLVHQAARAVKLALGKAPPLPPLFAQPAGAIVRSRAPLSPPERERARERGPTLQR